MYDAAIVHFAEVAREKSEGLRRSRTGFFIGAMLAGAYIGIAMILALSCAVGVPPGVRPLVLGGTFGIGLILTVFAALNCSLATSCTRGLAWRNGASGGCRPWKCW